jgi:hypothetical protein
MVLIPLIFNYGINTNAMEIARFALQWLVLGALRAGCFCAGCWPACFALKRNCAGLRMHQFAWSPGW